MKKEEIFKRVKAKISEELYTPEYVEIQKQMDVINKKMQKLQKHEDILKGGEGPNQKEKEELAELSSELNKYFEKLVFLTKEFSKKKQ
jgi:hypothetical protein